MKKIIIMLVTFLISNFTFGLEVELIDKSKDKNFNGMSRGINVFQSVLRDDYQAINHKGLIALSGAEDEIEPEAVVIQLFQRLFDPSFEGKVGASWKPRSRPTILDRGYINDGEENPRIPEKFQKVVDLYNSQIMGAVNGNRSYQLIIFTIDSETDNSSKKGWIIFNKSLNEALFAASVYK
jgi:hypothetical protein